MKPSVFFLIQKFESKPRLQDSAGYLEVAAPMMASGLIGETMIYDFGKDLSYYDALIGERVASIKALVGENPVVVYGAGAHTERYLKYFRELNLVALSDSDSRLWGKVRFGLEVIPPDAIPEITSHVVISTRAFESAVADELTRRLGGSTSLYTLYAEMSEQEGIWLNDHLKDVRQRVLEEMPDILFYTPAHPAERVPHKWFSEIRAACPKLRIAVIWWDYDEQGDDNPYLQQERESLQYADLVIENSNGTRLARMQEGCHPYERHTEVSKVHFMPSPVDPAIFYPEDGSKQYDIAIFGSAVGVRADWIDALQQRYGERFHHIGGVYRNTQPLSIREYAEALQATRIVINTQTYPFRSQCKGRVREALACGSFLLEEDNPETRMAFREGHGLIFFSGMSDLTEKVDHYLQEPSIREGVVEQGLAWYAQHNSPHVWTSRVLDLLSQNS